MELVWRLRAAAIALLLASPTASAGAPAIEVLSNRSDLISDGDVLIEVVLPEGTSPASVGLLDDGAPQPLRTASTPKGATSRA